jgi:dynein heavy chain
MFDTEPETLKLYLEDIPVVGTVAAQSFRAPRAFAFIKGPASCGKFTACSVLQRRKNCKSLYVEVCDSGEKMWMPRVAVLLKQDSAPSFMRRFSLAVKANALAEANLRYNLYLDNMPTDEVSPLPTDVIAIMSQLACNSAASNRMLDSDYLKSVLIPEVCREYVRSVNRSIFDFHRSDESSPLYQQYAAARLPPLSNKPVVPEYGLVASEPVQIQATKNAIYTTGCHFSFAALRAMQRVRHECQKMMAIGFFQVDLTKTLKLPDFKRLQAEASKFGTSTLKRSWMEALRQAIYNPLVEANEPDLDPNVTNKELYEKSKLKRLLSCVALMVADTLRDATVKAVSDYADFIEDMALFDVTISSFSDIKSIPNNPKNPDVTDKRPLFSLELGMSDQKLLWSTNVPDFQNFIVQDVVEMISGLKEVPLVDTLVVTKIFLGKRGVLPSLDINHPEIDASVQRIIAVMQKAIQPLFAFENTMEPFSDILNLDIDAFMKEYEAREGRTLASERKEVEKIMKRRAEVEALPASASIGMFHVDLSTIRNSLMKKMGALSHRVMSLVADRMNIKCSSIEAQFSQVAHGISKAPSNIEEATELKELVKNVPKDTQEAVDAIEEVIQCAYFLDDLEFEMSDDLFNLRWKCFGWPYKLEEQCRQTNELIHKEENRLKDEMIAEQATFVLEVTAIENEINEFAQYSDLSAVEEISANVRRIQAKMKEFEDKSRLFNSREGLFGLESTDYERLGRANRIFEPFVFLWVSADNWIKWHHEWLTMPFENLDAEMVEREVTNAWRNVFKSSKAFADVPGCLSVANDVKAQLDEFKPHLPLITSLRNPGLRERHWKVMSEKVGFSVMPGETLNTLNDVFDMKLPAQAEAINGVCDVAGKEFAIESALDKMQKEWAGINITFAPYRETGTYVFRGSDEIQQILDDHIVMTQAMSFSPFKKAHETRLKAWEVKLSSMSDIVEAWLACQKNWMYLEPIFSSEDIMRQLPAEGQRFRAVDRNWRKWMGIGFSNPHALTFTDNEGLLDTLTGCNATLELVQKGLSDYLETKRKAFARFFFLSNDELLEILSQTKDPRAVQPHLKKCFEAIHKVEFENDGSITAMYSGEGEKVPWVCPVYPTGAVENWLGDVERMMFNSVRKQVMDACESYPKTKRTEWVLQWPGQVTLAGDQVYWTKETAEAISAGKLAEYRATCHQQLLDVTELVTGDRPLSNMDSMTLGALVTLDVHGRDVIQNMVDEGVKSTSDFEWIAQLRYYIEQKNGQAELIVRQVESPFSYGYEYLGNSMRLVITPLTDRIYLTLTGALALLLGGAPAGPAGTGKTESVKDLAKAISKQCVVFNCQEGLDYLAMGKFFKGLAMAGAWACFDEFNRIDIEVLSVIAQQLLTIRAAVLKGQTVFMFEGTEITLNPTNATFITMNPGYAGRTELPDNLKALFRPVACMVPDYGMIGEIRLFSFGFKDAKALSLKMVSTFKLASEQLSSQDHYDFGMRAVNTVISAAGLLKRAQPKSDETLLMLRSLKDSNLPKFLADDIVLFSGIISDLFPGIKLPDPDYGNLLIQLKESCTALGLQAVDQFIVKCIQLYDVTVLRHGLMVVGPTGGGKTSCYNVLLHALSTLKKVKDEFYEVTTLICNPKSITMGQLYGAFDDATHEWTDGILCELYRAAVQDTKERQKWVIFDGPVDALWIESMNTVLDDNKKLCLVSGEIISMTKWMRMVFEVEDLAVASPATVSRCGMIYMEPQSCVGTAALTKSWIERLPPLLSKCADHLKKLCDTHVQAAVDNVRHSGLKEFIPTVDNNLVQSFFRVLDGFLLPLRPPPGVEPDPEYAQKIEKNLDSIFWFSILWSIGGSVDGPSRVKFASWFSSTTSCKYPKDGSVYEYFFDIETSKYQKWMETIPPLQLNAKSKFNELIVPTQDSICYSYLIQHIMAMQRHVLCVGPTGTGKTLVVKEKLSKGMPEHILPIFISFSAQTSANQTQDILDGKFDKRRKGVFGPPSGKINSIFIDDVNMPAREKYFAQPPIELLRQWMDHEGWYDRKARTWRNIVSICFVGALGPPGGGRNPVTPRFLRHFNHIAFPDLSDASLKRIFTEILNCHLKEYFPPTLFDIATPVVDATVHVYNECLKVLLPTPAKSHYTFNLRDLAKIFQGMMMADPKKIGEDKAVIVRLWIHESSRVIRDRLINMEDRIWFDDLLKECVKNQMKMKYEQVVTSDRIIFGDYMVPGADPRLYVEITNMATLRKTVETYLEEYNANTNKPMKLVMFLDAIEHVSKISRVIRQPKGNILLLGVGGSGRQSLTRLASAMSEMTCKQIEIAKGYGKNEWKDDLKKTILAAGAQSKKIVFLFSDTQIVMESFLEDINNVLNSGEIPNVWDLQDQDVIFNALKASCVASGVPLTKFAVHEAFLRRVMENLHIALAFSPVGDKFRTRLRQFPSLVNCCTIDWFLPWPDEALRGVATEAFSDVQLGDDTISKAVVEMCRDVHQAVEKKSVSFLSALRRYNYVTPTSYLELLSTFKKLLAEKRGELTTAKNRLVIGLDKIITTEEVVSKLKEDLTVLQPILDKTSIEVEEMMVVIAADKESAAVTKELVAKEEAAASSKAAECKEIKDSAEKDLAEALPALAAAVKCLENLSKADISEVGKYSSPPALVKLVIEGICIMRDIAPVKVGEAGKKVDDFWTPGKKMLGDPKALLDAMFGFDKDNIPERTIKKIQPIIDDPDFDPKKIESVSKACTAMCQWVRAMHKYHFVAKGVEPKRILLAASSAELAEVTARLTEWQAKLKEVVERLDTLEKNFDAAVAKKAQLAQQKEDCVVKLDRAGRLLGGLGGEKVRWQETVKQYSKDEINVIGDIMVAAGGIAYNGAFTAQYRSDLTDTWAQRLDHYKIVHSPVVGIRATLSDPVAIRNWNIYGLPTDSNSLENAIIISKSRRWPLMIDPQGQASKWIKSMEKQKNLDIIKLTEKEFLRSLVNGVRFGKPILLENVGQELDPSLEPVLLKQTFKQGGSEMIKIGDDVVAYHPDFKFYITTKLPNPHYPPETCVKVTLLNFTVNQTGLEDQLLGIVVQKERPDLQQAKEQLVIQNAKMKNELKGIEDEILRLLASSSGDILADESLITTLSQAKVTATDIGEKVIEAEKTEKEIDETREKYRPTAYQGSLLFFCVADLSFVDLMYQYSLQWFINLFIRAIDDSPTSEDVAQRCASLNDYFLYLLYKNICRGLFEMHKLLFSFTLCVKLMQGMDKIDAMEWRYLLTGATQNLTTISRPQVSWLLEKNWQDILSLSLLPSFQGFAEDVAANIDSWGPFYDSNDIHRNPVPGDWDTKGGSVLGRLMILRCFRPDKLLLAMQDFISKEIGEKFIDPPTFNLAEAYEDSSSVQPLLFVITAGTDPVANLTKFAEEVGFSGNKLAMISLGQGQGPIAEKILAQAVKEGTWVLLQNCHLAVSWMNSLERFVENLKPEAVNPDFRLWLTCMSSPAFPVSVLQISVKMTMEPPKGVRQNLLLSYADFNDAYLESCNKPDAFRKLTYGICFFHAVIQERRKFGPLGWNISYDFTASDLKCCTEQLLVFLNKYEHVPYKVLTFLSGQINYGGRVTDDWDRRALMTMLSDFINEDVLSDDYRFSPSGVYTSLPASNYASYISAIRALPISPQPEIFGLHENADITCAQNEVNQTFELILSLQPRLSSGGGKSRDEVIGEVAASIASRTPKEYDFLGVQKKYPVMYEESMNTVLQQEVIRYNKLVSAMHKSLKDLQLALKGIVVMSGELEAMADSLFNNFVPEMWASKAFPSLKPLSLWIQELLDRLSFIQNWIDHGIPKVYWISGFFFPQAFLTGTLQNYARRRQISISTVSYVFKVQTGSHEDIKEAPPNGCYVYGLFVEGNKGLRFMYSCSFSMTFQVRVGEAELRERTCTPLLIRSPKSCSHQWLRSGSNARKIVSSPRLVFTIALATRFSLAKVR